MDFNTYQEESKKTAVYPDSGSNIWYPTLGLVGETGEVAEKIKKVFRDQDGKLTDATKQELSKELGDVLWYLAELASELKLSLDDVAVQNITKLQSRQDRKKLHGNGDNR